MIQMIELSLHRFLHRKLGTTAQNFVDLDCSIDQLFDNLGKLMLKSVEVWRKRQFSWYNRKNKRL